MGRELVKSLVTVDNFRLLEFGAKGSDSRAKEEEWKETVLFPSSSLLSFKGGGYRKG